jgi:DNA-binding SARP family transcriptional activator
MPDPLAPLAISLFGPFQVRVNGVPLPRLRAHKGDALLALLTLRHDREVERAWLAGILWPDCSTSHGLSTMRRYLTDLRRALGLEARRLCSPTSHSLAFDLTGAAADVIAFDAAMARGNRESLEEAVGLYKGPLLEEWTEEWVFEERQAREQRYLEALEELAADAIARSDLGGAERHLRRAVVVDPLRESAQRRLMEVLAATGSYAAATQLYRELRLRLHRELSVEPAAETRALYDRIRTEARGKAALGASGERPEHRVPARVEQGEGAGAIFTFLLTDIEGSTRHWLDHPEAMRRALACHDALAAAVIDQHGGRLVKQRGEGDSLFAVFSRATDAVVAALDLQRALAREPWPAETPLKDRVALHTGEAEVREGDYYGLAVNHGARLRAVGHGGQVLLSQTTAALAGEELPEGVSLRELGVHRLKDLQRPEPILQLTHPDLPAEFPPLRSLEAFAHNLPVQLTSFIGREGEITEVKRLLGSTHLLTLTGAGGVGRRGSLSRWRPTWRGSMGTGSGWRSWHRSRSRGWYRRRWRLPWANGRSPTAR